MRDGLTTAFLVEQGGAAEDARLCTREEGHHGYSFPHGAIDERARFLLRPIAIEDELATLSALGDAAMAVQRARTGELCAELAHVGVMKEAYVAEHPEQRALAYRRRREAGAGVDSEKCEDDGRDGVVKKSRCLFYENGPNKGLPRHLERSVYLDPVMNPFGVQPQGVPYKECRASFPLRFCVVSCLAYEHGN